LALALGVAILVMQIGVVAGGKSWDDVPYQTQVAPPRLAVASALRHRELPAWWEGAGLGVPLLAEPSHAAMYPPGWFAASQRGLDLVIVLHVLWLALGVAVWARRQTSELGALVAGTLVATTGIVASAALRGALPAIAHLPWIGWAASALAEGDTRAERARPAALLGILIAAVALAGELGIVIDAVVLACVLGTRRTTIGWLAAGVLGGLAIGAAQWLPAVCADGAGGAMSALSPGRLVELFIPGSFGALDPARAVPVFAGTAPWAPSVFVGAPLVALAVVVRSPRRLAVVLLVLAGFAAIAGRGAWPAWLGAPELHLAAIVVVVARLAASGIDAFVAGERRAVLAISAGAVALLLAMGATAALGGGAPAIRRALIDAGLGAACMAGAIAAMRFGERARPLALGLLVGPGLGALHASWPTIDRASVTEPPSWARVSASESLAPRRVYRAAALGGAFDHTLEPALATFAGTSPSRWGLGAAHSADPARPSVEDRVWLAAAHGGGELLARFGIDLAVLPAQAGFTELGRQGEWALVKFPVSAPAEVIGNWSWQRDEHATLRSLFPPGGGRGKVGRDQIVLAGDGVPNEEAGAPKPCTIERWDAGAIDLTCMADAEAYAAISSTAANGWTATVDDVPTAWVTADVLRRAVPLPTGSHHVRWRYATPGLSAGLTFAAAGIALLAALGWIGRKR
jgi:hypothetical protein